MRISDWSSDVCSSDLRLPEIGRGGAGHRRQRAEVDVRAVRCGIDARRRQLAIARDIGGERQELIALARFARKDQRALGIGELALPDARSEERRVGKEWVSTGRSRWLAEHEKQKKERTKGN